MPQSPALIPTDTSVPRTIADCVEKWMRGEILDEREQRVVQAARLVNDVQIRLEEPPFRSPDVLDWWRAMCRGEQVHPCARSVVESTLADMRDGRVGRTPTLRSHDPEDGRGDDYDASRSWPW